MKLNGSLDFNCKDEAMMMHAGCWRMWEQIQILISILICWRIWTEFQILFSLTHSSFVDESEQKKSKILLSLIQALLKNLSTNPNSDLTHAQNPNSNLRHPSWSVQESKNLCTNPNSNFTLTHHLFTESEQKKSKFLISLFQLNTEWNLLIVHNFHVKSA